MGNQLIPPTKKNYFAALNRMRESSNSNVGSPKNALSPRKGDEVIEKLGDCCALGRTMSTLGMT